MGEALNAGSGLCPATCVLAVQPVRAVIELGAAPDVLRHTLAAVHHINRHASREDFLAIAFPRQHGGRVCEQPGEVIEAFGSEPALTALLATEGMATLLRRGMIRPPEVFDAGREAGQTGAAYVRDRSGEKWTARGIARMQRRAERRGVTLHKITRKPVSLADRLTIYVGRAPLHIREVIALQTGQVLTVSTYGLSSPGAPAILPVMVASDKMSHVAA